MRFIFSLNAPAPAYRMYPVFNLYLFYISMTISFSLVIITLHLTKGFTYIA